MGTLSKAAETRLYAAVEKTAELVQSGEAPSAAIAKAAQAHGVPAGHVNLMVHAFNTGQTTRQRQAGDGILEKAADFPLADAAEVLELMYPTQVKTAAAVRRDTALSTEYALSPTGLLERRNRREKQARQLDWSMGVTAPAAYPRDPVELVKRADSAVHRLQVQVDEARRKQAAAFDAMGHTFCELSDYFRRPGCVPIPVVKENAMLIHGDRAEILMDQLVAVTPGLAKMAHNQRPILSHRELRIAGRPYELITQMLGQVAAYKEAKAHYEKLAADASKQAEVLLSPFAGARPSPSVLGEDSSTTEKRAIIFGGTLSKAFRGLSDSVVDTRPPEAAVQKDYDALTDPSHEAELRDVKTEAMLQYLMENDPEISGYSPDEVLAKYNELVDAVPRAGDQMLLMRTLLKKTLSGEMDTHEIQQALDMGEKIRARDEVSQSELTQRQQAQQSQQFREQQQFAGRQLTSEEQRAKKELEHRQKELKSRQGEFKQTHRLNQTQRADQVAQATRAHELGVLGHRETARHNVVGEHLTARQLAEQISQNGIANGHTREQIDETIAHNLRQEGHSDAQIAEAVRHNREQETQGRKGLGLTEAQVTGKWRGRDTLAGRQAAETAATHKEQLAQGQAALTGRYNGNPTLAARTATGQAGNWQAQQDQMKAQRSQWATQNDLAKRTYNASVQKMRADAKADAGRTGADLAPYTGIDLSDLPVPY